MTPHRDPLAAALARAEAAEAALARATAGAATTRYVWRMGDKLAAPVIIGGYPMGVLLIVAAIRLALPLWAGLAAIVLGFVWWALALLWMHEGER